MHKELFDAINSGDLEWVKSILKTPDGIAGINFAHTDGTSALHLAVQLGHLDIAKYLLNEGADVNVKNLAGETPLHIAAKNCSMQMIDLICSQNGVKINAKNNDGRSPLYVIPLERTEIFQHLLNHGADISTNPRNVRDFLTFNILNPNLVRAILISAPNCLLTRYNKLNSRVLDQFIYKNISTSSENRPWLDARVSLTKAYEKLLREGSQSGGIGREFMAALQQSRYLVERELANIFDDKHLIIIKYPEALPRLLAEIEPLLSMLAKEKFVLCEKILSSPDPPNENAIMQFGALITKALLYSKASTITEIDAIITHSSTVYDRENHAHIIRNLVAASIIYGSENFDYGKEQMQILLRHLAEKLQQNYMHDINAGLVPSVEDLELSTICHVMSAPKIDDGFLLYNLVELLAKNTGQNVAGVEKTKLFNDNIDAVLKIIKALEVRYESVTGKKNNSPFTALKEKAIQVKLAHDKNGKDKESPVKKVTPHIPKIAWVRSHLKKPEDEKKSPREKQDRKMRPPTP